MESSERQVVFCNALGAPLVLACTDPSVLSLAPDDAARLSLHIRTRIGGPLPDRFVIEKVDDFALAIYKDRIEFVSGAMQSSSSIDFADLASKSFTIQISVLWSRFKISVICGTKMCIEVDRSAQGLSATPHRTLPSTSTILIDAKLASRLQRLVWTKNSLPVLRVVCDGSGGDITVSWIQYRLDRAEPKLPSLYVLIGAGVVVVLLLLVLWARMSVGVPSKYAEAVAEMQSKIAEMQALPRSTQSDDVALALREHLAAINRRLLR